MARIKIDITEGFLEVEGNEQFVSEIYSDFKKNINLDIQSKSKLDTRPKLLNENKKDAKITKSHTNKRKSGSVPKMPKFVKDLDLVEGNKNISLDDFVDRYEKISTFMEWNTVFVYFLQKITEVPNIGIDHIYTCYKKLNKKTPSNIYQSLVDTARTKGTIKTETMDSITITIIGENFIEHEFPQKKQPSDE